MVERGAGGKAVRAEYLCGQATWSDLTETSQTEDPSLMGAAENQSGVLLSGLPFRLGDKLTRLRGPSQ